MYDSNGNNHQPSGAPGTGQFASKAGVGSTEAFHRLASITDRAEDKRMERGRAARHPLPTRPKGLFRRKPSPTPPLPPKWRGHGVIDPKSAPSCMRDEARAAFVESHPDPAIEHVSYDRGDGRYDRDFHADGFDRKMKTCPAL